MAMDFCTWLEARNRILGPYAQSWFGNRSGFGSIVDQSNDSLGCFWQWWVGRYLFSATLNCIELVLSMGFWKWNCWKNVVSFLDFSKVGTAIFQGSICPLSLFSAHLASAASDYAEMSSRYKANHINRMIWWIARKTHEISEQWPDETWIHLYSTILLRMYHSHTPQGSNTSSSNCFSKSLFLRMWYCNFLPHVAMENSIW